MAEIEDTTAAPDSACGVIECPSEDVDELGFAPGERPEPTELITASEEEIEEFARELVSDDDDVLVPQPGQPLTPAQMKKLQEKILSEIDDHTEGFPDLSFNAANLYVWALESTMVADAIGQPEPGIIITFANSSDPRGTPVALSRDRALKFASQVKKQAMTGPAVPEPESQLIVPPQAGKLIVPG